MAERHDPYVSLRNPNFLWYVASLVALTLGTQIQATVVAWQVYALTKDPLSLGLVGLAEALPFITAALYAGHIADRHDRKLLSMIALAVQLGCGVALLLLTVYARRLLSVTVLPIFGVVAVSGLARSFLQPARTALGAEIGEDAAATMDRLRAVSDEWLAAKAGGEKGFSLGSFSADYLSRFDIAVMERDGEIIAFANLWAGSQRFEFATDLIRHTRMAPPETMEALLMHVMAWGKTHGYRWFSLGVAPLSGLERSPVAPFWGRVGSFLYTHGEAFYRFRGVRAFKQKFHPQWEPRYLVYPGGLGLPRIVVDVSVLIAGGYRKVVFR